MHLLSYVQIARFDLTGIADVVRARKRAQSFADAGCPKKRQGGEGARGSSSSSKNSSMPSPLLLRLQKYHLETLEALAQAMASTGTLCAVMLNPAGPDLHVLNRWVRFGLPSAWRLRSRRPPGDRRSLPLPLPCASSW